MANEFVEKRFPIESLKPKKETGVINFLKKYPEYNGKNVNIAIFDSGVDPQSLGLKVIFFFWGYVEEKKLICHFFNKVNKNLFNFFCNVFFLENTDWRS